MRPTARLAVLGFGSVGRALARLLLERGARLARDSGLDWRISGLAARRLGWQADPQGLDLAAALAAGPPAAPAPGDLEGWLEASAADVLVELTSLEPHTGQPAIDHLRAALQRGLHAVTANKGPVVHAHAELQALAASQGAAFLFESTVMDGAPVFSLFREALPGLRLERLRGVLNSTTNYLITRIEQGLTMEAALEEARARGITETDPSADLDGWDAAVKLAALATVLMGVPTPPQAVQRRGIRELTPEQIRAARAEGRAFKLICRAARTAEGGVQAAVAPESIPGDDPLASLRGTSSAVCFETDLLPGLTLIEHDPGPETTAYGVLADLLTLARRGLLPRRA